MMYGFILPPPPGKPCDNCGGTGNIGYIRLEGAYRIFMTCRKCGGLRTAHTYKVDRAFLEIDWEKEDQRMVEWKPKQETSGGNNERNKI